LDSVHFSMKSFANGANDISIEKNAFAIHSIRTASVIALNWLIVERWGGVKVWNASKSYKKWWRCLNFFGKLMHTLLLMVMASNCELSFVAFIDQIIGCGPAKKFLLVSFDGRKWKALCQESRKNRDIPPDPWLPNTKVSTFPFPVIHSNLLWARSKVLCSSVNSFYDYNALETSDAQELGGRIVLTLRRQNSFP